MKAAKLTANLVAERVFRLCVTGAAAGVVVLFLGLVFLMVARAWPALSRFGWGFLVSEHWDPVLEKYGGLPVLFGTLVSSTIAMALAAPVGLSVAIFLTEIVPRRVGKVFAFFVELLAAVPSVVIGLWGIFVLVPFLRAHVYPALKRVFGFSPLFEGPIYGVGMLTAGILLAIMVVPTVASLCREVFRVVPRERREAALALGATRWEVVRLAVLGSSRAGVFAALILGLGRALGETMAVTMVIGNRAQITASLFAPGQTMASTIANEYAEATSDLHLAALGEVALVLFAVTLLVNFVARAVIWKVVGAKRA